MEADNKTFFQRIAAGEITQSGMIDDDNYAELLKKAKQSVENDAYPKFSNRSTKEIRSRFLVAENWDFIKNKGLS